MLMNLCYIGDHGIGKKTKLLDYLRSYAQKEGVPFNIKTKYLMGKLLNSVASAPTAADSDSDDDTPPKNKSADNDGPSPDGKSFPFEVSAIHQGYDVARMSLQDKNYVYTIFKHFQGSSYVLSKQQYHFFVFYHAHLLSEESIIYLQEKIEQYSNCLRIFLTSQYPLPIRLADHFVEVYLPAGPNHLYKSLECKNPVSGWTNWFTKTLAAWNTKKWLVSDVVAVRNWIYFCLQRNLRWCEMIEYWTKTIEASDLPNSKKIAIFRCLAFAEGGGGWQIIPSYRIPLLWEHVLLEMIKILRA
jgi:hypothetical protein